MCQRGAVGRLPPGHRLAGGLWDRLQPPETIQEGEGLITRIAALDRRHEQLPCFTNVASIKRRHAIVQQLVRLALVLGEGGTSSLDVGACPRVASVEEPHSTPDGDRPLILAFEVVIETREKQLINLHVVVDATLPKREVGRVIPSRIGHEKWWEKLPQIMGQTCRRVNRPPLPFEV